MRSEKVLEASEPVIEWCPLFDKVRGIKHVTSEAAAANMDFRIEKHGMFSPRRKLDMNTFVGFGASESMMTGLERGIIDAAVTVCDGAGTVITANGKLVQGMGGYISGLKETEAIADSCPFRTAVLVPAFQSVSWTVPSQLPVARVFPSGLKATLRTVRA